jgi:hypothetical protein
MSLYSVSFDHDLYPGDLIALEFLKAAEEEDGVLTYGDTSAVGDFFVRTDATTTTMAADALAFWTTGVADAGDSDAITGFSTTTAREYFDCFVSDLTGTGTWLYSSGANITGANFAKAVRGLYAHGGYTLLVESVVDWLRRAASNPTYEETATESAQTRVASTRGVYDPDLALATELSATTATNTTALYDWSTFGLMAPVQSARDPGAFTVAKKTVADHKRRGYGTRDQHIDRLSLRGKSGMGLQVDFTETIESGARRVLDAQSAAIIGTAYREAPKIYSVRDHVPRTDGLGTGGGAGSSAAAEAAAAAVAAAEEEASSGVPSIGLIIPTYIYPSGAGLTAWNTIIATTSVRCIAIANPNSGPGASADANYTDVIGRCRTAGVTCIGYVSTSYGARAQADVLADVDKWKLYYPSIAGIFFDEQSSNGANVALYTTYFNYARSVISGAVVASNPGTACDQGYRTTAGADVIVMAEAAGAIAAPPAWAQALPDTYFGALAHGCNQATMGTLVAALATQGYGYAYITDDVMPNPWNVLATYYAAQVTALEAT